MRRVMKRLGEELLLPVHDYFTALAACNITARAIYVIATVIAFLLTWWVYVPVHELFHAFGCMLGGGDVSRLEISGLYGAALLQEIFPFVAVGSEYAGRLTGFDTHGSDLTYLLTVFFPYLLTILIGLPMLRSIVAGSQHPASTCVIFGSSLPVAYAPFISITGDYYEMGSILITKLASLISPGFQVDRLRSDDLIRLVDDLVVSAEVISPKDVSGIIASFLLGVLLIFVTFRAGRLWAYWILRV